MVDYSAVIVGVLAFAGTAVTARTSLNRVVSVMEEKINNLQKAVDKHNSVIERTYKLEADVKTAFIRIDEIRDTVHEIREGGVK